MTKTKQNKARDTKAQVPTMGAQASISNATWTGLRDTGFSLLASSADNANLGTQTLAASILALLAERPVTVKPKVDANDPNFGLILEGDHLMLADYWNVYRRNANGDKTTLQAFKTAVYEEMLPTKPEADTKGKLTVKTPDYMERLATWNKQRAALNAPFDLACALASREYDAGDFIIGHGFNIERRYIVPAGFSLDKGNVHKPQSEDDVICLDYSSPLAKSKPRSDQTTHIRDKSAGIAVVTHTFSAFMSAQRPAAGDAANKGMNLAKVIEYLVKQSKSKDAPKPYPNANDLNTALAYLSRVAEVTNAANAKPDLSRVETDGTGNVKVA